MDTRISFVHLNDFRKKKVQENIVNSFRITEESLKEEPQAIKDFKAGKIKASEMTKQERRKLLDDFQAKKILEQNQQRITMRKK